jgi:hypothetical protein
MNSGAKASEDCSELGTIMAVLLTSSRAVWERGMKYFRDLGACNLVTANLGLKMEAVCS